MRGGAATLANLHTAQTAINKAIDSLSEGNPDATVAAAAPTETTDTTLPIETTEEAPQTGGKTKKSKRGNGKKRKLNNYMKFANTRRKLLMKTHPGKGVAEIAKMLGCEWRALSDAAKAGFNA